MNLQDAIGAARAESLEQHMGHRTTRDRVLESCERSPRRRLHAVVAAVIASMFGASAFAWYARPPQAPPPRALVIAQAETAVAATEPVHSAERTVARVEPVAIEEVVEEEPVVRVEPPAVSSAPAAIVAPSPPDVVEAPPPPPVVQAAEVRGPEPDRAVPARDTELELYATAHQLHFQRRDLPAALDAWERYLAAAPHGRLAPEARFNRLVALVRLKRWDEAARAIETIDAAFRPRDIERLRALIRQRATSR